MGPFQYWVQARGRWQIANNGEVEREGRAGVLQLGKRDIYRCSTNKNWGRVLNKPWDLDA